MVLLISTLISVSQSDGPMQLSAQQLSRLLDEVSAMVRAKHSLTDGLLKLHSPSLGRIGRAARRISKRLESGQSPETAFTEIAGPYGPQVSAALATLQSTESAEPITRFAETIRRQSELKASFRVAMIYPLVTVVIAYLIITLGVPSLIIDHWPMDVARLQGDNVWLKPCLWLRANFWWPPLILLAIFALHRLARRLGWRSSGVVSKFQHHIACSMFCDMLAVQMESQATLHESLPIAAQATGNPRFADNLPPMVSWLVARAAKVPVSETTEQLHAMASWYHDDAMRRGRFWVQWFPSLVTVFSAVSAFVAYSIIVMLPLYESFVQVAK